jgi:hypothetical protein
VLSSWAFDCSAEIPNNEKNKKNFIKNERNNELLEFKLSLKNS